MMKYVVGWVCFMCFTKSAYIVDKCLELKPNCWKALNLKEVIAYCCKKHGLSSILGVCTTSVIALSLLSIMSIRFPSGVLVH
uniref:Mitochondrial fission 1 protein A n=1 Tax=Tanacetum cinerariifolium TaxID=118510 RepID=A0A6L2L9H3_TANCI|nr:mitochondrial fission 1 protein A [Tanacetum cinerariifolium]